MSWRQCQRLRKSRDVVAVNDYGDQALFLEQAGSEGSSTTAIGRYCGGTMKTILMTGATVIALAMAGGAQAQADALMKANGCMNCHAVDTKKVGPAFKDIAAKFKGKADAEKTLVAQLKDGKGHPAVKASEADIGTMVKFVLAQ